MRTKWSYSPNLTYSPFWEFWFHSLGRLIDPLELVASPPQPPRDLAPREGLIVRGKGPNWFFYSLFDLFPQTRWCAVDVPNWGAAVVARARSDSPVRVGELVRNFDFASGRLVEPTLEPFDPDKPEFRIEPIQRPGVDPSRGVKLRFVGGRWISPHWLSEPETWRPLDELARNAPTVVELSGPMPIWLAVAALYRVRGVLPNATMLIEQPVQSGAIVLRSGPDGEFAFGQVLPDRPRDRPAPCVALVGDPQSGKSTLSWKIYHELMRLGVRTYRLDCDAQAPTAPWGIGPFGEAERKHYKSVRGGWTIEDVRRLTMQIQNLKRSQLQLVLLDMPGGDFKADPPQRIPDDRIDLFREVDFFVRLDKSDVAREGWSTALAAANLADRVVASVETRAGDGEESWPVAGSAGPAAFRVHQLDRERYRESSPAVEQLTRFLVERAGVRPAGE